MPRWFLPISGELKAGGHYQIEGNAGGTVESCDEPARFAVTWEFAGMVSWLEVQPGEGASGTTLELIHEAPVDPKMWEQFWPGAVGLGWDGALCGLDLHLTTGESVDPAESQAWSFTAEGKAFFQVGGEGWAQASIAHGGEPDKAIAAAERSIAAYSTPPEEAPEGQ